MLFILWNQHFKFDNHSRCGSGDTTCLICYVTLQDHVIKGPYGAFMEVSSSLHVITLPGFGHCGSGLCL